MTDFTRTFDILIDASVHDVFEYCRDPRHLFEGWPELDVTDVVMTPEGVGTTAHIVGRFAKGMIVEQIERTYTEVVPDERIVSKAHVKVRLLGRTKDVGNGPVFTCLFAATGGGTTLTLVVLEEDIGWWQNLAESASAVLMGKKVHGMLAAIKSGAESRTPSAA
ncbi:SRPBCC family protein [Intrasporangium sp. DVR]|uniref:SRPBCC family protein n=1 Tax=Intrasporangium sp. DVR TaxID=3127867 RepID=UPI00313A4FBA